MEEHNSAILNISSQIKGFYSRKEPFRIYHGSTNSTRKVAFERRKMVDTSHLAHVLQIDKEKRTVLVEPNLPMDSLVEETLKFGLLPPVVMEFPGITVGGGFAGTAGESSSFKYGFFDRTINWIEMVLATGEVVTASSIKNSDLFYGAASSFGTLGVTTLLEIQLIEAKSYVELMYYPISSIREAQDCIDDATKDESVDYLDGIMFAKNKGVICSGRITDTPSSGIPIQRFTRPTDPWFYLHVSRLIDKSSTPFTETVPIVDYLFRYDRGGFWVARYAFRYFITPFNRITRFLLDYFMHTRVMYHALHQSGLANMYIIQDVAIPYPKAEEFMDYLDITFKQYPIWLCPLKQSGSTTAASTHALQVSRTAAKRPDTMLNFGVWGPGPKSRSQFVKWNRGFEHKVNELGGQKWLYAQTYYTKEEFYQVYDREPYDRLRKKYGAEYLPSVYDKVKVDFQKEETVLKESWKLWLSAMIWSIWPLAGLYGVWKTLFGGDYLLSKRERVDKDKVA